jgi:hypothetical protein
MRFSSEKERSQHPFAKQIPLMDWNLYFNNEWLPIHETLLMAPYLQDFSLFNSESDWNAEKIQSCLICMFINDKPILLGFWKQFLERFPRNLNNIFKFAARFGRINTLHQLWIPYLPSEDIILAFQYAAENGHLAVLKQLKEWAPDKLQHMIVTYNFSAFKQAAAKGHLAILEQLKE